MNLFGLSVISNANFRKSIAFSGSGRGIFLNWFSVQLLTTVFQPTLKRLRIALNGKISRPQQTMII